MGNISHKKPTLRSAKATATVAFPLNIVEQFQQVGSKKGDWQTTARIAGMQAAKRTYMQIPMCHPIALTNIQIDFEWIDNNHLQISSHCQCFAATGVEIEALNAVTTAALTVYDMAKALSHRIEIKQIRLLTKEGGKSDFAINEN